MINEMVIEDKPLSQFAEGSKPDKIFKALEKVDKLISKVAVLEARVKQLEEQL